MHIYCKKCNKHTGNTFLKKIILISKNKKFIFNFLLIDIINMKTYCLKCRKDTDNIDPKIFKTKNNKLLMQLKCSNCKKKKSTFVKEQEAKGLLSD